MQNFAAQSLVFEKLIEDIEIDDMTGDTKKILQENTRSTDLSSMSSSIRESSSILSQTTSEAQNDAKNDQIQVDFERPMGKESAEFLVGVSGQYNAEIDEDLLEMQTLDD